MSNLPAVHELQHLVDQFLQGVPDAFARLLGRAVDRACDRVFGGPMEDKIGNVEGQVVGLDERVLRLEATLGTLDDRLRRLDAVSRERVFVEIQEPATFVFISTALAAALQTKDEGKQRLLGDLIADRLSTVTESFDELELRLAERIVEDCSAEQLLALARIMIVTSPPATFDQPVPLEKVLRFFNAVDKMTEVAGIAYRDMRYLVSLGAITESVRDDFNGSASLWMNYFAHWKTLGQDEIGRFERQVQNIADGRSADGAEREGGAVFGDYELTPPGEAIARNLTARIAGFRLDEPLQGES